MQVTMAHFWMILNSLQVFKKFIKKCSNGHGGYFLKCHYCNLLLINVQSPKNPHKFTSTFTLTKANVIFQFKSLKRTTHKVHMNSAPSKNFKKYAFGTKKN
jgi:hypothetical protein